ncbi:unnamed protein product [Clonostachys rosea]|uniref:Dockerin type 1 n=1 Tax=Bionectria ochroleuca TaxID=29856 RepID=A0ABY6U369_BIOOC|nr:unnamed protein product [Clonostachys rosea]
MGRSLVYLTALLSAQGILAAPQRRPGGSVGVSQYKANRKCGPGATSAFGTSPAGPFPTGGFPGGIDTPSGGFGTPTSGFDRPTGGSSAIVTPTVRPSASSSVDDTPTSLPSGFITVSGDGAAASSTSSRAGSAVTSAPASVTDGAASSIATPSSSAAAAPSGAAEGEYVANPSIGAGGSSYTDSDHFRVYNGGSNADAALQMLEGAFDCFINTLGFRSTGLSYNDANDSGTKTKVNIYSVSVLEGAAGVMHSDASTGMAYLEVVDTYLTMPGVTVHEFGHGIHYHQKTWVGQTNTGAWWETFANWVAETYKSHDLCAASREKFGQETSASEIELTKTISDSYQVIVDGSSGTGNYYQAWPFFTYLTSNPDNIEGLGSDTLRQMNLQYKENSDETPLHVLARVATGAGLDYVVGRYWAHMAYVDIGMESAHTAFTSQRKSLNYDNVDSTGSGSYKVKSARAPQYMGANIIPLTTSASTVSVEITAASHYTATFAVYASDGSTRYVDIKNNTGSVEVASGEEVSLVVANTPEEAITYNGFELTSEVKAGLDYSFTLTGATVTSA